MKRNSILRPRCKADKGHCQYLDHNTTIAPTLIRYDWRKSHDKDSALVYANCWNIQNNESKWMWKNYSKLAESVAIQPRYERLKNCFNGQADGCF
jgi:hypothetical protein